MGMGGFFRIFPLPSNAYRKRHKWIFTKSGIGIEPKFLQADTFSNASKQKERTFGTKVKEDGVDQRKSSFGLKWFKEIIWVQ